jgi:hypothetical protein
LAWLLVLVLLLPLAQAAASWHLLAHVNADPSKPSNGNHAIHIDHCDLCLTAVALTGGALPLQPSALAPVRGPVEAPRFQSSPAWFVRLQQLYESRAPPASLF